MPGLDLVADVLNIAESFDLGDAGFKRVPYFSLGFFPGLLTGLLCRFLFLCSVMLDLLPRFLRAGLEFLALGCDGVEVALTDLDLNAKEFCLRVQTLRLLFRLSNGFPFI